MDVLDVLRVAARRWPVVLAAVAVAVGTAAFLLPGPADQYTVEGSFTVVIQSESVDQVPIALALVVEAQDVADELTATAESAFQVVPGTDGVMAITARAGSADEAVDLVTRVLQRLVDVAEDDVSLRPRPDVPIEFVPIETPISATVVADGSPNEEFVARGTGIVRVRGLGTTLDSEDTLDELVNELLEIPVVEDVFDATDGSTYEIETGGSGTPIATVEVVATSEDGARQALGLIFEQARIELERLGGSPSVSDRATVEVIRPGDDVGRSPGSVTQLLVGITLLALVLGVVLAVIIDAGVKRRRRPDARPGLPEEDRSADRDRSAAADR